MPDLNDSPVLREMIKNVLDRVDEIKTTMATKEFVQVKLESFNDRVTRVETDVKDWIRTSTAEHTRLDKDMQAQEELLRNEIDRKVGVVNARIDALELEQKEQEKALRAQRNGRAQAVTIAILGSILSVVGSVLASGIIRGIFPS